MNIVTRVKTAFSGIFGTTKTTGMETPSGGRTAYEGASRSYRMQDKGLYGGGPNTALSGSLRSLRSRARHAVRNNAYATSAIESYTSNLVGNGIKAKWNDPELQRLWEKWVNDCDNDGDENFHGIQALVARGQFESGEAIVRMLTSQNASGIPLQLQVIESDHLDEAHNEQTANGFTRMGITFGANGKKRHYNLWRNHPEDHLLSAGNTRIPVRSPDIIHIFRKLRAGQIRGIPELSPILIRLYELDEMQDATLVRQKTAALFGWIVRKRDAGENWQPGAPQGTVDAAGNAIATDNDFATPLTKIVPGGIHYLEDDEDITFSQPADIAGIYTEYLKTELRAIAAGMGITYEQLTGDLTGVNYSSIRAGLIEFRRRIEFLQLTLIVYKFCQPIADKWLRLAILYGKAPATLNLENYRDSLPEWRPPRWEWVDPLKDVQADLLEVRAGFATLAEKQLERGSDPEATTAQLEREQSLNLVLDTNPAKVQKSGAIQQGATDQ